MTELKPCPFCGSDDVDDTYWSYEIGGDSCHCVTCGAIVPLPVWNTRPSPWHPGTEKPQEWNHYYFVQARYKKDRDPEFGALLWLGSEGWYTAWEVLWWLDIPPLPEMTKGERQ